MKKYLVLFFALSLLLSCSKEEIRNNNPYLPSYNFDIPIDMNLPAYNNLMFTANPVVITVDGIGINGIVVMNTGSGYVAYENTCPNQEVTTCSVLVRDGILMRCLCDGIEYSLFDGSPTTPARFGLRAYRVQILSATSIRVYN
jgi:nitrite reductase/ring-hydroxylating ferredoxin subunit